MTAMDMQFRDIFAGKAFRGREPQHQCFIDQRAGLGTFKICGGCHPGRRQVISGQGAERRPGVAARQPDNGDTGAPLAAGQGENGVLMGCCAHFSLALAFWRPHRKGETPLLQSGTEGFKVGK